MPTVDLEHIRHILASAHEDGRSSLYEHECYDLLTATGAEAAPRWRLIPAGSVPTRADLEAISSDLVVLKVVSPDIVHKTEAKGVRIVAREAGAVDAAYELMRREVPEAYGDWIAAHAGKRPSSLEGLQGEGLRRRISDRTVGTLLCSYVEPDAGGFATELFVGLRATAEFGPIISAGLGGVEMEVLARRTRRGAAVAIAPTGTVDGAQFLELFKRTLSYERLSGRMRGSGRLVSDAILEECFQAFIDTANHFSEVNPDAPFHIHELEVNPFTISGARIAPVDGVCSFGPAEATPPKRPAAKIANLLKPSSVAVVGVSESSVNMGRIILRNILEAGFPADRAFVVRPGTEAVDGVRCVDSIAELPEKVDLFVVAVAAAQVPDVTSELIEHDRANAVILVPGGIGEKEGSQALERRLKESIQSAHRSEDGGPVFLGGNSLGVISHPGRYDTMFIPETKLAKSRGDRRRPACFISQSGAFIISNLSRQPWLDPAYSLSIGNQIDLTASDLLDFIKDDPQVEVLAVYMEGFQPGDGLAMARAVRAATELGKDVVFYKAGRTSEGRSATAGHTASVAGDYAVCATALEQAGAMVADDFNEFSDLLRLCLHLRDKEVHGNRLMAVSNAGYESVGMADSIRHHHAELELAQISGRTEEALGLALGEYRLDGLVDVKNPFDVTPMASDAAFTRLLSHVVEDDGVDLVVAGIVPLTPAMQTLAPGDGHAESIESPQSIARQLPEVAAATSKPLVAVIDSGERFDPLAAALTDAGLPVFRSADRAVRVLCKWTDTKLRNLDVRPQNP
jgi:acyl-CoA synthetase (NDP forming)